MNRLSKTVMVAPFRPPDPNSTSPVSFGLHDRWPARCRQLDLVPDLEVALLGRVHVERDLVRPGRVLTLGQA